MFYYFIDGSDDVFEREEEIDTDFYPQFKILNGKEKAYYLAHPGSTRSEIKRAINEENHKPTLDNIKENKRNEIKDYDASDNVNGFYIGGSLMWLAPAVRDNYMNTLQGAQRLGISGVTFMGHEITPEMGIMMLDMINLYAMQCVGVTDYHIATVMSLGTEEEVNAYDYTVGYPEMLRFYEPEPEPEEVIDEEETSGETETSGTTNTEEEEGD